MKTEENSVVDIKKLTDEEVGKLYRKMAEIVRRSNEGTISFEDSIEAMQKIIIEGKSAQHLDVIKGLAEITYPEYLIDCNAAPFIPSGFTLVEHKAGGLWKWNSNIHFYLSEKQKKGKFSAGNDLRKELATQPVLDANVLDYLLAHPELIPERWKGKSIVFWGTIYRNSDGNLCVRYLYWNGSEWRWDCRYLSHCYRWLGDGFGSSSPAALAN